MDVQIPTGRRQVRVTEELAHVVGGHARFVEARTGFVPQIAQLEACSPAASRAVSQGSRTDPTCSPTSFPNTYASGPNSLPAGSRRRISSTP